jgi:predicted hydrocarbon binding protein
MSARPDRLLPNRYLRFFLRAVEEEMGSYSLRMILRKADLERFMEKLPPRNRKCQVRASEFAAMQAAIRSYYGSGARGSFIRIARSVWRQAYAKAARGKIARFAITRFLSQTMSARVALELLARLIKQPDGQVSVHFLAPDIIFVDTSSDSTVGQDAQEPICWYTLGLIQVVLSWAECEQQSVHEISCRAVEGEACKFRIALN